MGRILWLLAGLLLGTIGFAYVYDLYWPESRIQATCDETDLARLEGHVVELSGCGAAYARERPLQIPEQIGKLPPSNKYYGPIRARRPDGTPARFVAEVADPDDQKRLDGLFAELVGLSAAAQEDRWAKLRRSPFDWRPHRYVGRVEYPAARAVRIDPTWALAPKFALVTHVSESISLGAAWGLLLGGVALTLLAGRSIVLRTRGWLRALRRPAPRIRAFAAVPAGAIPPPVKVGKWTWLWPALPGTSPGVYLPPGAAQPRSTLATRGIWAASRMVYVVAVLIQIGGRMALRNGIPFLSFLGEMSEPVFEWARWLDRRRRSLLALRTKDVRARDARPPVLLLRSFLDDGRHGDGEGREMVDGFLTFEELLVEPLSRVGPVIAVGQPGEPVPTAGAARAYVGNAAWQGVVEKWMQEAALIVLVVGDGPGLSWELAKVRATRNLHKLVLVIPNVTDREARRRVDALATALGDDDPWGDLLHAATCDGALMMVFHGEAPQVFWGIDRTSRFYGAALALALDTRRRVLALP